MVKSRHLLPEVAFDPSSGWGGVDISSMESVRRRAGDQLHRIHRADFHVISLVAEGVGFHEIDFQRARCRPGTVLWIRAGQVQRFDPDSRLAGRHLLFVGSLLAPGGEFDRAMPEPTGHFVADLDDDYRDRVGVLFDELAVEVDRADPSRDVIVALLAVVVAQLAQVASKTQPGMRGPERTTYIRFRHDLEAHFAQSRTAAAYAQRLGYSAKSLNRACLAATGRTAKQLIDERVILEAQRLLAHTTLPVITIGRQLGFAEPTQFTKFFVHRQGTTPTEFRDAHR